MNSTMIIITQNSFIHKMLIPSAIENFYECKWINQLLTDAEAIIIENFSFLVLRNKVKAFNIKFQTEQVSLNCIVEASVDNKT